MNNTLHLSFDPQSGLIQLSTGSGGPSALLSLPVFEIEGRPTGKFTLAAAGPVHTLPQGALEQVWSFTCESVPGLRLEIIWPWRWPKSSSATSTRWRTATSPTSRITTPAELLPGRTFTGPVALLHMRRRSPPGGLRARRRSPRRLLHL
jgi:hypothetical protein